MNLGLIISIMFCFFSSFPCPSWLGIRQDSYLHEEEYQQLLASLTSSNPHVGLSLHNSVILYKDNVILSTHSPLKALAL